MTEQTKAAPQYKMVPRDPTRFMRQQGDAALHNGNGSLDAAYRAMLAAAPEQPAPQPVAHIVINRVPAVEDVDLVRSDDEIAQEFGDGVHPLFAVPPDARAVIRQLVEALEAAQNGLQWYRDEYPNQVNEADAEADEQIATALAAAAPFLDGGDGCANKN